MIKRIILSIIIIQIILICLIVRHLFNRTKNVLGEANIDLISSEEIVASPSSELIYFYEPKPNSNDPRTIFKSRGKSAEYKINSDALNERYNYSAAKPVNTYRIITLGASFTFGLYVNTEFNWTEILEDRLNSGIKCEGIDKYEVLNLGYNGYDNDYVVERYRRRGIKYDPDFIIWLQTPFLIPVEKTNRIVAKYYKEIHKDKNLTDEQKTQKVIDLSNKARKEVINKLGMDNIIKNQTNSLLKLKEYYTGDLLFAVVPDMPDKEKEVVKLTSYLVIGWDYFDGLSKFSVFEDGHPDLNGHKTIAEDIFKYLAKTKFSSCKKI